MMEKRKHELFRTNRTSIRLFAILSLIVVTAFGGLAACEAGINDNGATITDDTQVPSASAASSSSSSSSSSTAAPSAFSQSWSFTTEANYSKSASSAFSFASGVASLALLDQTDDDNDDTGGFAGGSHTGTQWDSVNSYLELDGTLNPNSLPDNSAADGWIDMTANILLIHGEESAGATTFADSSSSTLTATCLAGNCPTARVDGQLGSALQFNGSDSCLDIPASLSGLTKFSVMFWVKPNNSYGTVGFFNGATATMYTNSNLLLSNGTNHSRPSHPGRFMTQHVGRWVHRVYTYDAAASPTSNFYADGASMEGGLDAWPGSSDVTNIRIGCATYGATTYYLDGVIDEVAIFDDVLTESQINTIYKKQAFNYVGEYTSRVMDTGADVSWSKLSWTPSNPYGSALPAGAITETVYDEGNIDMSGNTLLLHFDEDAGSTAWDNQMSETDLTYINNFPTSGADGIFGKALRFEHEATRTRISSDATLDTSGDWTAEYWFRERGRPTITQTMMFSYMGVPVYKGFYFSVQEGSVNKAWFRVGTCDVCFPTGGYTHNFAIINSTNYYTFLQGGWEHVAVTRSGDTFTVYINGEVLESRDITNYVGSTAQSLWIGNWGYTSGSPDVERLHGDVDEVAFYERALSQAEIQARYHRGQVKVEFQVRSCVDADCSDADFEGPNDAIDDYFYYAPLTDTLPFSTLSSMADARYFQYKAYVKTRDSNYMPKLKTVGATPTHYNAGAPYVINNIGITYSTLFSFTETLGGTNEGTVTYQISNNGTSWYYYNGSNWVTAASTSDANTAATIDTNISTFVADVGAGTFYFKAIFTSTSGTQKVELDDVAIGGTRVQ